MAEDGLPILEFERLQRRTMGSQPLQVEILSLFSTEAERLVRQAGEAEDPQTRSDRLSALGALAHGIGAVRLADAAEKAGRDISGALQLDAVESALREVLQTIASDPDIPTPSA